MSTFPSLFTSVVLTISGWAPTARCIALNGTSGAVAYFDPRVCILQPIDVSSRITIARSNFLIRCFLKSPNNLILDVDRGDLLPVEKKWASLTVGLRLRVGLDRSANSA